MATKAKKATNAPAAKRRPTNLDMARKILSGAEWDQHIIERMHKAAVECSGIPQQFTLGKEDGRVSYAPNILAPQPDNTSQMQMALKTLAAACSNAHDAFDQLVQRLDPILLTQPPYPAKEVAHDTGEPSAMRRTILSAAKQIEALTERLDELRGRADV